MDQAGTNWRESRERRALRGKIFCGIRRGASAASSGDAVSDRGALASAAAAPWSQIHRAGALPEVRENWRNLAAMEEFALLQDVVKSVRAIART